ncbi:MAG: phosphoribosylformylglycinamidine synthase subunit PurL [Planctomycetaceae bacterium]|nr:phosphoribosylformylglycinamidine synthase subunit PurL [Planctomycetaceae bacterium]
MLWEVEIAPAPGQTDREGERVLAESRLLGAGTVQQVCSAKSFLIEGTADRAQVEFAASELLADPVAERFVIRSLPAAEETGNGEQRTTGLQLLNVLYKPGVTDNVASSTQHALNALGLNVDAVSTCRKYWLDTGLAGDEQRLIERRVLSNEAIERILPGPLQLETIALGSAREFELKTWPIRQMSDPELEQLSTRGQLYLDLTEMQTIQQHFRTLDRDPTDAELETIAQTWSEHCSHKTLAGRIHYQDDQRDIRFENMLRETIFAATQTIRQLAGDEDWCVSVFKDNAGIVTFEGDECVCFKVETHNHPSAIEPYGGANTGIGGVIRDSLGTGLGARPVCNTDIFCFAPPDMPPERVPEGALHPRAVAAGVVAGVRDYGNRMGIPTVNGSVFFDERYLGNPLVYCGNVAMIPRRYCEKKVNPGDLIVSLGGRTGRDGIHGATFSSTGLTQESEMLSGGAVQIGNAITEKMVADVLLEARDRGLYTAVTDCGAGGFSSAVGEMGEDTGAEVWLERAPLKYAGLSYTEIWISEAQERMVVSVPPEHEAEIIALCAEEGVEATVLGRFTDTGRLVLKYHEHQVADLSMDFLHNGRPPVVRTATYTPAKTSRLMLPAKNRFDQELLQILGSWNVCSREWIIRQYDHEVQAGSVVKPLVGVGHDGPSDAAVIRPDLTSDRGLVISNGMNPLYGEIDTWWMAASAIDEAIRNCVATGADPSRIALLDNFCWGRTSNPEVLGSLVRAAIACQEFAVAFNSPFISGKDSLNNEFDWKDDSGNVHSQAIPSTLLISALGQIEDVGLAVTMDLKASGNQVYLLGATKDELGGSHLALVCGLQGGEVPRVNPDVAVPLFHGLHAAMRQQLVRSCHDLSEGGLAVAAAEMAFAGGLGLELDLSALAAETELADVVLLFSESNSRFLVEVEPQHCEAFEAALEAVPLFRLGTVTDDPTLRITGGNGTLRIDSALAALREAWKAPLNWS